MRIFSAQNYSDPNKPNYRPQWWADMVREWEDALAWTGNLRREDFKNKYLRSVPGEFDEDRQSRLSADSPEPFFKDAVRDHASIFSQFEIDDDAPETVKEYQENIDLKGTSMHQWATMPLRSFFRDGAAILGADIDTQVRLGMRRPRLLWVPMRDVFWPEYRIVDGIDVLSRLSIRRSFNRLDKDGKLEIANQFYVYELDDNQDCFLTEWVDDDRGNPVPISEARAILAANGEPLKRLPFTDKLSVIGDLNTTPDEPILSLFADVLSLNIEHYNARSEYNAIKTKVAIPTLDIFLPNPDELRDPIYSGSGKARVWPESARVEITQLDANGLDELRQAIYDIETKLEKRNNRLFYTKGNRSATEADIENQKSKVGFPNIKAIIESAFQDVFQVWELFAESSPRDAVGGISIDDAVLETAADPEDIKHYLPLIQTVPQINGTDMGAVVIEALKRQGIITGDDIDNAAMMQTESPSPLNELGDDDVI